MADEPLTRADWLAERKKVLGGTDIAAVLGLAPWRTIHDVWLDKTGRGVPVEETEAMRLGRELEGTVGRLWAEREGRRIERAPFLRRPDLRPWAGGTPDFIVHPDSAGFGLEVLEVKTTGRRSGWGGDGEEGDENTVPPGYLIQLQNYLWLASAEQGWFAVLMPGDAGLCIRSFEVRFDPALWEVIVPKLDAFWRLVETRTPPALDGSESATAALRALFPQAVKEEPVALPPDAALWMDQWETARMERKAAEEAERRAAQELQRLLGDASTGVYGEREVNWRNVAGRRSVDTKALERDHPRLVEPYRVQGEPTRRFDGVRVRKEDR